MRAALAQYENAEAGIKPGEALRKIAETVVVKALVGDKDAVKEIADRLDGKPAQAVTVGNEDEQPFVTKVVREIVRAKD